MDSEPGTSSSRSGRRYLSLSDKVNVIEKREKGISEQKLSILFNVSKSQINQIYANRELVLKDLNKKKYCGVNVKRKSTYEGINNELYDWYTKMTNQELNKVTGPMIKKKALELARNKGFESFKASNGWLYGFQKKYKIVFQSQTGTAVSQNKENDHKNESENSAGCLSDWIGVSNLLLKQFSQENIFNIDITTVLYKTLTSKSSSASSKLSKNQMSDEILTILIGSNATGEKFPPVIVGNSKQPECLNGNGLAYFYSSKALLNTSIMNKWLKELDFKMGVENRRIVILMENFPCEIFSDKLENIVIKFLPDSVIPFKKGVTENFKLNLKKMEFEYLIAREKSALESSEKVLLLDGIRWVKRAWEKVDARLIKKCFNLCDTKLFEVDIDDEVCESDLTWLAQEARTDFDEVTFKEEMKLISFDLEDGELERRKVEGNVVSQMSERESVRIKDALMSVDKIQQLLNRVKNMDNKGKILSKLMDIQCDIEEEIVRDKIKTSHEKIKEGIDQGFDSDYV